MSASVQWDLIPGVVVRVFAHELQSRSGVVPCFTYVTDGLRGFHQKEIAFTLVRDAAAKLQHAPADPLHVLRSIAELARQGRLVDSGGVTEVGPQGLFGVPALRGFVYAATWPIDGVTLPPETLSAVALVGVEMETAKRYGALRVLARLGRAHGFFPTAYWCDPTRAPLMDAEGPTILEGVASAHFDGVSVVLQGETVVVRVARGAEGPLRDALPRLPPEAVLALRTTLDPEADGCLVWSPGQRAPEAILPPGACGARLSGCFALFVPQQAADGTNVFEDGFAAMLTDATWTRVRQALMGGTPIVVPAAPGAKAFAIEWIEPRPVSHAIAPVGEMQMVLREKQADIDARVGMDALVVYADAIEGTVKRHLARATPVGAVLHLDVVLAAGRAPTLAVMCWPETPALAGLTESLYAIPAPPIRFGEIAFRGSFALFGGPPSSA